MDNVISLQPRTVVARTPLPPEMLAFRGMVGHEALSQLYELEVDLVSPSHSLDMKQLLGKPLTLDIEAAGGIRYLTGHITRCKLAGREGPTSRLYRYRATVRPWLWYLTQTSDSKIFQNKNVPDVIREVLADYPFPVEFKLAGSYRNWEYCVQYQETDFAFISRLMEHEGIYYWFRHDTEQHTLVLTDDITQHETCPGYDTIPYYGPDRVSVPQQEYISSWEIAEQITPGAFATSDYHFQTPSADLQARRNNPGDYEHGDLEMYEWQGGYTNPADAEHYTRVRLEELQCRQEQINGACNVHGMAPGYLYTLRNHPRQAENREYLIVSASYRIQEAGEASGLDAAIFDVGFTVLPSSTPFRAPRVTPIPHTHGPQTARVVGKTGEQIWTDSFGRIKVQFHWDRYGQKNENSSCWVRVSSPWAGGGFGGIQLPRVNDEVIIDFIGGHPDRPIVIGRVYNASNMPPWDLPGNATQSGFLSRSKDGTPGTANAFMFEDKPGSERIWLHAERELCTEVENDETHTTDGFRTTTIGKDDTTTILGSRDIHVHGTDHLWVKQDRTVDLKAAETYTVKGARTMHVVDGLMKEDFDNGLQTTILAAGEIRKVTGLFDETLNDGEKRLVKTIQDETVEGDVKQTITGGGQYTQTITAAHEHTLTGDQTSTITGTVSHTINGSFTEKVTDPITVNADTSMTVNTPSWTVSGAKQAFWTGNFMRGTPARLMVVGASLDVWGARQQIYGINSQFSAVKLDLAVFKNGDNGFELGGSGTQIKGIGVQIKTGGAAVISRIVNLFT
ncbi:type VI secretion system Vgr family protein [Bordetella petrii]|uniref:type VI secretion system Vgr family protein n=1 Tax=Bordetella petrii TaxID=94624 RepID=UPI001E5111E0|nr:type VI secretion system tip protein VgrG [Bordetella petrii]MCD0502839.1 type VI secretion system tip protein VgrG [Bordetella petrii]